MLLAKAKVMMYLAMHESETWVLSAACSFLATRVNKNTEEDMSMPMRLLKYLNGSKELESKLTVDNYLIIALIEASRIKEWL